MTEPSTDPDRTEVREIGAPRPKVGEVSIDVAYAGINFIDVMARRGDQGYATAWPYVPGHEVAGIIREVGPGVVRPSPGDRVAAFTRGGGLAGVAVAAAALVVPLPEEVPFSVAAAAPLMLSTALLLLTDVARFEPGETVLMHSASGGIGSAVAQLVPALGGGRLIGTVGRAEKIDEAKQLGWDVALVRDDHLAAATRAAAERGVDIVLDPFGTRLLELDIEAVRPGGRIVMFGNASGGKLDQLPPLGRLMGANIAIAGFSMSRLTATAPERASAALRRVLDLLAVGTLCLSVTTVGSLEEVAAVHQLLADGRGSGKYVTSLAPHN